MKKLINDPRDAVDEMIEGFLLTCPNMSRLASHRVVVRSDLVHSASLRDSRVAVVSGGGSGHEPHHCGFVGKGMLSAAVLGDVFASPSSGSVLAAIKAVTGKMGCLLVVKNFAGDRVNFATAAASARRLGYQVETVLVRDDCALRGVAAAGAEEDLNLRRGLAGTMLVHKVAGAAAERALSLEDVKKAALSVIDGAEEIVRLVEGLTARPSLPKCDFGVTSMGLALSGCSIPGQKPSFTLEEDEIEEGVGIHGEKGVQRSPIDKADVLVAKLLDKIVLSNPALSVPSVPVVVIVNNLGGSTLMELSIVARSTIHQLEQRGLVVEGIAMGPFMTSLEMAGVSLSVLPVTPKILELLAERTEAPAWPLFHKPASLSSLIVPSTEPEIFVWSAGASAPLEMQQLWEVTSALLREVVAQEPVLTALDQQVGDGDMGICAKRTAEHLLQKGIQGASVREFLASLAFTIQDVFGGTAGGLIGVLLSRMSESLPDTPGIIDWAKAFKNGVEVMQEVGGAKLGDKTMLDSLIPASEILLVGATGKAMLADILEAVAKAAEEGAQSTKDLPGRRGRSSYIGARAKGFEDPGARLVAAIFRTLAQQFR